jgi:GAF domain-containing protein
MSTEKRAIRDSALRAQAVRVWRQETLRQVVYAVAVFGTIALGVAMFQVRYTWLIPLYIVVYAGLLVVTLWRQAPYNFQAIAVLAMVYIMGVMGLLEDGLSGDGRVFLLTLPLLAVLFYGWQEGVATLILSVVTLGAFAGAFSARWLVIPEEASIYSANWGAWLSGTLVFLALGVLIVISLGRLVPRLSTALTQSHELVQELEEVQVALRERAEGLEATRHLLEERTKALQANAEVARETVSVLNLPELLERIVTLISARFNFHHTSIYLLEPTGGWAELQAASSESGRQMVAQGHRLRVGAGSLVGRAISEGRYRMIEATDQVAQPLSATLLPGTRAQIAFPLRARGAIIGALDVQSQESAVFDDEQVTVLQALADQAAIAISNARLFQQVQESVEAERQAYGKMSASAWQNMLRTRAVLEQRYDPQGILPTDGQWRKEMKQAARQGISVLSQDQVSAKAAAPIKVRGQVIGVLDAHKPADEPWTAEQVSLLETLTEQLGVALDSARLYQDTRRHAAREQLTRQITDNIRAAVSVEDAMQRAVGELARALGTDELVTRIGTEQELLAGRGAPAQGDSHVPGGKA